MNFFAVAHELLAHREAGLPWDALARLTGWQKRSVRTIVGRARSGKMREPGQPRHDAWTPAMDALLLRHWETENSHQIAARVGRSHWAVNARASRKGLVKPGARSDWWSRKVATP